MQRCSDYRYCDCTNCSHIAVAGDSYRVPGTVSGPFRQVVGLLQFMTGESLQQLYYRLFGADDHHEDDTSFVTTDALQEFNSLMHAATQPMEFEQPAGLHLFKGWTSQEQQVRVLALCT